MGARPRCAGPGRAYSGPRVAPRRPFPQTAAGNGVARRTTEATRRGEVGTMIDPSRDPSRHALLPGAPLAVLVTCAALLALAVVAGVRRPGPDRLWLGGGDSSVSLEARSDRAATPARPGPGAERLPLAGAAPVTPALPVA